ncbi:MAG: branched-chain amino acid transport system permease protein [Burkholderiales bacterium]|jgi:branched-chain amino acid transport system permease protein
MKRALVIVLSALLACLPWLIGNDYYINLASQVLIAALFALSLNLLVGYAGLTSLGHAGYLGLSAYVSGWLMLNLHWGHFEAAAAALIVTTIMAALFGLIALRASGLSFLMITLALSQILWGIAYRWAGVTGGDNGLSGLTRPAPFGLDLGAAARFYHFTLIVFLLIWGLVAIWVRSPFGASIRGTKDQPRRMSALGYNVWLIRWITFTVSGFLGAVAGLMYVYYHQFISPHSLSLANSAEMLLMVIAGGPGTLTGPVLGAAVVVLLKNVASAYVDRWIMLLGFVFIFIVMFVPGGLVPGLQRAVKWLRKPRRKPVQTVPAPASHAIEEMP